jgi:euchromatic histone-lysine N-methyltransferase
LGGVSLPTKEISKKRDKYLKNDPEFCIDAGSFGNVSRFINHGCSPNLFVQCVLSNHLDVKLARVVLFAAKDIPPYQVIMIANVILAFVLMEMIGQLKLIIKYINFC